MPLPWAAIGLGVNLLGSLFGGGSRTTQSTAGMSPLQQYMLQESFLRGMQRAQQEAMPESFRLRTGEGEQQQQPAGAGLLQLTQNATQAGGQSSPGSGGAPKMLNMQGFLTTQPAASQTGTPPTSELYNAYLRRALSGNDVLPAGQMQGALATGMDVINRQAAGSAAGLQESLGSRGLLHSGVLSRGLADVERARLGQVGSLTQDMLARQLEAARLSQRSGAELYAAGARQDAAIEGSRPSVWDQIAGLVGAGAQWYYGRPTGGGTSPTTVYAPPSTSSLTNTTPLFPY